MKRLTSIVWLLALAASVSQAEPEAKEKPKQDGVLKSDLVLVMSELDRTACKKLGLKPTEFFAGKKEGKVTREELIGVLSQLHEKYRFKYRVTPRPFDVYSDVINKHNTKDQIKNQLKNLSEWGLIGPVSFIVVGTSESMTNEEVGDTLGYFYSRVMTYSHQPDPDWTPDLQGE